MLLRIALTFLLVLFVAWSPRVGRADPPPAEFTIQFDGDASIWNPFEDFASCQTASGVTTCVSLEDVVCDGAGRCAGQAQIELGGAIEFSGSGPFTGRMRCVATPKPNDPICSLVRLRIAELFGSIDSCEFALRLRMIGPVDHAGLFHGSATERLCTTCPGASRQCSAEEVVFEDVVNPPTAWSLTVDSQQSSEDPLRLVGTAEDSLGFSYRVRGERSVGNGVSTLRLRGVPDTLSEGARIKLRNLVFSGDDLQGGTAKIRVQGNRIREKLGD